MDFDPDGNGHANINLRYVETDSFPTDLWGPFSFAFADKLTTGDEINAVTVKCFYNASSVKQRLKPRTDEADFTDISALVVDPAYAPTINADDDGNNTVVYVKFQHPGLAYKSLGIKATLVFEITTISTAKKPFYFHYVEIE